MPHAAVYIFELIEISVTLCGTSMTPGSMPTVSGLICSCWDLVDTRALSLNTASNRQRSGSGLATSESSLRTTALYEVIGTAVSPLRYWSCRSCLCMHARVAPAAGGEG